MEDKKECWLFTFASACMPLHFTLLYLNRIYSSVRFIVKAPV